MALLAQFRVQGSLYAKVFYSMKFDINWFHLLVGGASLVSTAGYSEI